MALTELIKDNWDSMPETQKDILGMPNFSCARIAHRMKEMGFQCRPKSEEEQALVISTMLFFYNKNAETWSEEMNKWLVDG